MANFVLTHFMFAWEYSSGVLAASAFILKQLGDYWLAESKVMGYKKNAWEDAFLSMFI